MPLTVDGWSEVERLRKARNAEASTPGDLTEVAFISYSTMDKVFAGQVRTALECFLAHDDLRVSDEWKERILLELARTKVFVPLLSKNFKASDWAPQEVGFFAGRRDVVVMPISLASDGTIPFGFIATVQGEPLPDPLTRNFFFPILAKRLPRMVVPRRIDELREAGSFRRAEALLEPPVAVYPYLTGEEINDLVDAAIGNGQVWNASLCRTRCLPQLLRLHQAAINPAKLETLVGLIGHE